MNNQENNMIDDAYFTFAKGLYIELYNGQAFDIMFGKWEITFSRLKMFLNHYDEFDNECDFYNEFDLRDIKSINIYR